MIGRTSELKYIFGPVASRRLGRSLGVDLVRPKICSLDCIYCEAGRTTDLTVKRCEYVCADDVLSELDAFFSTDHPEVDWITFSGAGEPLLNSRFGYVAGEIKRRYPQYKLCLLTNAVSLADETLWHELDCLDLIIPSVDGSNEDEFKKINRPAAGVDYDEFCRKLIAFSKQFPNKFIMELFIVPGINDHDSSIQRFCDIVCQMKLDRVQLNTLDRPGVDSSLVPSGAENTRRFIDALEKIVPVEAIGPFRCKSAMLCKNTDISRSAGKILDLIRRRSAAIEDITACCSVSENDAQEILQELVQSGLVTVERKEGGREFFSVNVRHFQSKGE